MYSLPVDSPLRNTHSAFWGIRTNDDGYYRPNSFYGLVQSGKIRLVAPARATGFGDDGKSVTLNDGQVLSADVVILATGFKSSWTSLFDGKQCMIGYPSKLIKFSPNCGRAGNHQAFAVHEW